MRHRWQTLTALLAVASFGLGGCTKVGTQSSSGSSAHARHATTIPHVLRIGDVQDINTLNPHLEAAVSLGDLSQLTMAYLARYDRANKPIPELATVIPTKANHLISADGKTIVWHLRRGVRWSDGAPFDADDVVFSTKVVLDPRNNEIGRDGWDRIVKIDEPDRYTVVYHLREPYSNYLPLFFGTAGADPCILPKHLLAKLPDINHAAYNSLPVGIGPFRYTKWVRGDHVELEANPYYWRGTPKLRQIIYKFIPNDNTLLTQLQTGEIDLWPLVGTGLFTQVRALPGVTTIHPIGTLYEHIDFNLRRPIFADLAVRQALRLGMDRAAMLAKTEHGLGVLQETFISPLNPLYEKLPLVAFDPARANALLDRDGWKRGDDGVRVKNGRRLAFSIALASGQPDLDASIALIQQYWAQLGAQLAVRHYTAPLLFAPYAQGGIVFAAKYDTTLFGWDLGPGGDDSAIFGCKQVPPNGENSGDYCDPIAERAMDQVKLTYGADAQRPYVDIVQKRIADDVPTIVLWMRDNVYSYNADLTGWKPNAVTPFDDMLNVDI